MSGDSLVVYHHSMSRLRFKQEVALRVVDRIMESVAAKITARFTGLEDRALLNALSQFEEERPRQIAAIAESIADSVTGAMGPAGHHE